MLSHRLPNAQSSNQNNSDPRRERNLIACRESGWCAHKLAYCSSWHTIGRGRKENEKDNRIVRFTAHCTLYIVYKVYRFDPFIESSEQTTFSAWKNLFCDQSHIRKCTSKEWLFLKNVIYCRMHFGVQHKGHGRCKNGDTEKKLRTISHAKHCQRYLTDNEAIL